MSKAYRQEQHRAETLENNADVRRSPSCCRAAGSLIYHLLSYSYCPVNAAYPSTNLPPQVTPLYFAW